MKLRYFCIVTLILAAVGIQAQPVKQNMQWQGEERHYYVYTPTTYDSDTDTLAVLFFLHGFDGGIDTYNDNIDFQHAAEQFRWLIVLPEAMDANTSLFGMNIPIGKAWNSGIEMTLMGNTFIPNSEVDDAGFLMALVDTIGSSYRLHPDSLFFAGFSMGAFMTYRMAIEHADRIDGVAAASGLIPLCYADSVPARNIDVIHIHGTDDNIISRDGSASPIPGMGQMTLGLSVENTIAYWCQFNQCDTIAAVNTFANTEDDGMLFTLHSYAGGIDGSRVALLSVEGGKHQWYEEGHDVQYLTAIHDFFSDSHSYAYARIESPLRCSPLLLFPNPADNSVTIMSNHNTQLYIYAANGKMVGTIPLREGANQVDVTTYSAGIYLLRTTLGQRAPLLIK